IDRTKDKIGKICIYRSGPWMGRWFYSSGPRDVFSFEEPSDEPKLPPAPSATAAAKATATATVTKTKTTTTVPTTEPTTQPAPTATASKTSPAPSTPRPTPSATGTKGDETFGPTTLEIENFLSQHWGKLVIGGLTVATATAFAVSKHLRTRTADGIRTFVSGTSDLGTRLGTEVKGRWQNYLAMREQARAEAAKQAESAPAPSPQPTEVQGTAPQPAIPEPLPEPAKEHISLFPLPEPDDARPPELPKRTRGSISSRRSLPTPRYRKDRPMQPTPPPLPEADVARPRQPKFLPKPAPTKDGASEPKPPPPPPRPAGARRALPPPPPRPQANGANQPVLPPPPRLPEKDPLRRPSINALEAADSASDIEITSDPPKIPIRRILPSINLPSINIRGLWNSALTALRNWHTRTLVPMWQSALTRISELGSKASGLWTRYNSWRSKRSARSTIPAAPISDRPRSSARRSDRVPSSRRQGIRSSGRPPVSPSSFKELKLNADFINRTLQRMASIIQIHEQVKEMRWYKALSAEERLDKLMLLERGKTNLGIDGVSVTIIPADPIVEIVGPDGNAVSLKRDVLLTDDAKDLLDEALEEKNWYRDSSYTQKGKILDAAMKMAAGDSYSRIQGVSISIRIPRPTIQIRDINSEIAAAERIQIDLIVFSKETGTWDASEAKLRALMDEYRDLREQLRVMHEAHQAARKLGTDVEDVILRVLAAKNLTPDAPLWEKVEPKVKTKPNAPKGMEFLNDMSEPESIGPPKMRLPYAWVMDLLDKPEDLPNREISLQTLTSLIDIETQFDALQELNEIDLTEYRKLPLNERLKLLTSIQQGEIVKIGGKELVGSSSEISVKSEPNKMAIDLNTKIKDNAMEILVNEYDELRRQIVSLPKALSEAADLGIDVESLTRRALIHKRLMSPADWHDVVESFRVPENGKASPVSRGWIMYKLGHIDTFADPLSRTMDVASKLAFHSYSPDAAPDSVASKKLIVDFYILYEKLEQMAEAVRFAANRGIPTEELTARLLARKRAMSADKWEDIVQEFGAGEKIHEGPVPLTWIRNILEDPTLLEDPFAAKDASIPPPSSKPGEQVLPAKAGQDAAALTDDKLWEELEQTKAFQELDAIAKSEFRAGRKEILSQLREAGKHDPIFRASYVENGQINTDGLEYMIRIKAGSKSNVSGFTGEQSRARSRADETEESNRKDTLRSGDVDAKPKGAVDTALKKGGK
ncbi:MAG: hypothetical protein ABH871_01005, partial [Pseudomonadota bacterium]